MKPLPYFLLVKHSFRKRYRRAYGMEFPRLSAREFPGRYVKTSRFIPLLNLVHRGTAALAGGV